MDDYGRMMSWVTGGPVGGEQNERERLEGASFDCSAGRYICLNEVPW